MKRKKLFIHLLFLANVFLFLSACDKEEVNLWENKSEIKASVYFISDLSKDTIPDVGAKIYFYYNLHGGDITQYDTYLPNSNGVLRNRYDNSQFIESDTVGIVPESGTFVLDNIDKNIDDIIMIIESNYYDNPQHYMTVYAYFLKSSYQPRVFKSYFKDLSSL